MQDPFVFTILTTDWCRIERDCMLDSASKSRSIERQSQISRWVAKGRKKLGGSFSIESWMQIDGWIWNRTVFTSSRVRVSFQFEELVDIMFEVQLEEIGIFFSKVLNANQLLYLKLDKSSPYCLGLVSLQKNLKVIHDTLVLMHMPFDAMFV
jgi:hypothetical protein